MYLLEARLAYACKHGFSIDTANKILVEMLKWLPEFPSSKQFGEKVERQTSLNIGSVTIK